MRLSNRSSAAAAALGPDQFRGLLLRLDPDRNRAGEKYEELRRKLIKYFEWNSCFPAETLADETLDRVARKLANEEIHDLPAFAWGIAKNVRHEEQKRSSRIIHISDLPGGDDSLPQNSSLENLVHEKIGQEQYFKCFRCCLQRLPERDRQLFLKYHSPAEGTFENRRRLADEAGLTIAALRVRINRMRDKLESCVHKCVRGVIHP
jgi:DNA-directed RNA polymerase specialized sigma24 family protein